MVVEQRVRQAVIWRAADNKQRMEMAAQANGTCVVLSSLTRTLMYAHTHTCTLTHTHAHVRTHARTHTHTCTRASLLAHRVGCVLLQLANSLSRAPKSMLSRLELVCGCGLCVLEPGDVHVQLLQRLVALMNEKGVDFNDTERGEQWQVLLDCSFKCA